MAARAAASSTFSDISTLRLSSASPPVSPGLTATGDDVDHKHEKLFSEISDAIESYKKVKGKWEAFSKELTKFHQYQERMAEVVDHFLEVFTDLAVSTKHAVHSVGDLGEGLQRVVEAFRMAESARRTALDTFKTELVVGVSEYIDRFKSESSELDRDFQAEDRKMEAVVKKAKQKAKEAAKKKGAALSKTITAQVKAQSSAAKKEKALADTTRTQEETIVHYDHVMGEWIAQRQNFLRKAVLHRRAQFCGLLQSCERVLTAQSDYHDSSSSTMGEPIRTVNALAQTAEHLPSVISKLVEVKLDESTSAMDAEGLSDSTANMGLSQLVAGQVKVLRIDDVETQCKKEAALSIQKWWRGEAARARLRMAASKVLATTRRRKAKKDYPVPRHLPYFEDPYNDDNMLATVTAMDLGLLVRKLTQPKVDATDLRELFLITHGNFIGPDNLLQFIILRFWSHPDDPDEVKQYLAERQPLVQRRCVDFLEQWFLVHFEDFRQRETHRRLSAFFDEVASRADLSPEAKKAVAECAEKYAARKISFQADQDASYTAVSINGAPTSIVLTADNPTGLRPDMLHPLEVARQLTILDFGIFKRVHSRELLKQAWCKDKCVMRAPHVLGVIERFNRTVAWGATEILRNNVAEDRARVICMLLDVANNCVVLQNYSALMALLTALQAAPVSRLKFTWELVPEEYMTIFNDLKDFMSMSYNYRTYREKLRKIKPPAVPYLGCILQDLTFIDDGNESRVGSNGQMINLDKERMTYNVIKEIMHLRKGCYALHPVATISRYLMESYVWSADRQYATSLVVEPRSMKPAKTKPKPIEYTSPEGSERPEFDVGKNASFLDALLQQMERKTFKAGEYIITVGEPGKCMYFISTGVCTIELPDGRSFPCNQGTFFGEIALFLDKPRSASVRAHTDVEVYILWKSVCDMVLKGYPEIYAQFELLGEERLKADAAATKASVPKWLSKVAGQVTRS